MTEFIITSAHLEAIAKQLRKLYGEWFDPDAEHPMFEGDPLPVLVRCRDCKHYESGICRRLIWRKSDFPPSVTVGDRYCAWGERREEGCL